ncbi:hypothetical protein [Rhizobium mayense]|uniref:Uncharacterized protein n=1 Tax=Rhizobium mayense TaxID=1312184 RepID=A0ABT7K4X6_9HYPH|nr:hypothetical protein [Rhizobium mayense]MDL2403025.1 hypothetical protein [Rhizobium mayense]
MPLDPGLKTATALWIAAARFADPDACDVEDDATFQAHEDVFAKLHAHAVSAKRTVKDNGDIAGRCKDALGDVVGIGFQHNSLQLLQRTLGGLAVSLVQGNGDGPACRNGVCSVACGSGVLEIAGLVEARIRETFSMGGAAFGDEPAIVYATTLTPLGQQFAPFKVTGSTDSNKVIRIVNLVLLEGQLSATDVVDLIYTLHHELICHAFQGYRSRRPTPNAPAQCHWSEGWMDTLAFDIAELWIDEGRSDWVPLKGERGKGQLRAFHEHRFGDQPFLLRSDRTRRRGAREAFRDLAAILAQTGMAASFEEADTLCRTFTWMVNTHPEAEWRRLKLLATRLQQNLLSKIRHEDAVAAAQACLSFLVDGDLAKLEKTLA